MSSIFNFISNASQVASNTLNVGKDILILNNFMIIIDSDIKNENEKKVIEKSMNNLSKNKNNEKKIQEYNKELSKIEKNKTEIEKKMNDFLKKETNLKIFGKKFYLEPFLKNGTILHALALGDVFQFKYLHYDFKKIITDTIHFFKNHPTCFNKIPNKYFEIKDDDEFTPLDISIIITNEKNKPKTKNDFKELLCLKKDGRDNEIPDNLNDNYTNKIEFLVSCSENTNNGGKRKTKRFKYKKKKTQKRRK